MDVTSTTIIIIVVVLMLFISTKEGWAPECLGSYICPNETTLMSYNNRLTGCVNNNFESVKYENSPLHCQSYKCDKAYPNNPEDITYKEDGYKWGCWNNSFSQWEVFPLDRYHHQKKNWEKMN